MKKLLLLLLFTTSLFAQNEPQLQWANKFPASIIGGAVNVVSSTIDDAGNVYFIGTFSNTANFDLMTGTVLTSFYGTDIFIAKYNANGMCLWAKNLPGSVSPKFIEFGGGAIYIAGLFRDNMDIDASTTGAAVITSNGEDDIFMAKYDLNGNYSNGKAIGGTLSEKITDFKFHLNQIHITGVFSETADFDPSPTANFNLTVAAGASDSFVAKYNDNLQFTFAFSVSGDGVENIASINFNANGSIFITGNTAGTTDFDPSAATATIVSTTTRTSFIASYSNFGSFVWVKNIGGKTFGTTSITPGGIVVGSDESLYVSGEFNQVSDFDPSAAVASVSAPFGDVFLAKYDSNGNYIWAGGIGGEFFNSLDIDNADNLYLTGDIGSSLADFDMGAGILNLTNANGPGFLAKYNSAGNVAYAYNLSNIDVKLVVNSPLNNLHLYGSFTGYRDFDLSSNNDFLYCDTQNSFYSIYSLEASYGVTKQLGNYTAISSISLVATDANEFIYHSGNFGQTIDINLSAATTNLTSAGWTDFYIAKYTTTGDLVWANTIGGPFIDTVTAMNTDPNGNIYVMGRFLGTVDFDPSANVANLVSTNNLTSDSYIAKYDTNGNYLWAKKYDGNFGVSDIKFDTAGNMYFLARFTAAADFDPSPTNAIIYSSLGVADFAFSKYNPQGDMLWVKAVQGTAPSPGSINETSLFVNSDTILITGFFINNVDFNPSPTETALINVTTNTGFVAKYDLDGNFQLVNNYSATGGCIISNALIDADDNLVVVSYFNGDFDCDLSAGTAIITGVGNTMGIAKYNPNGVLIWAKALQGAVGVNIMNFRDTQAFINQDNAIILNSVFFGTYDFDPSAGVTNLTSYIEPVTLSKKGNVFVAKYDINGDFVAAHQLSGQYGSILTSAALNNNEELVFTGSFAGTIDFDFTAAVLNQTSSSVNYNDRYIAKYATNTLGTTENELPTNAYTVYPNPAQNILNIHNPSSAVLDVMISDISGKVILQKYNSNETQINVANYPQGMYFVTLTNQQNNTKTTLKFIKE